MSVLQRVKKMAMSGVRDTGALILGATYCTWCTARLSGRFIYEHPVITGAVALALPTPAGVVLGAATCVGLGVRGYNAAYEARIGRHAGLQG